ncbi:hypothetical protein [Pedobacter insulae]|uniref:Uncharacterized protein n=1 Tax=Pedobacter insulae TaxID=414048 RepID=A0A1I2XAC8_9SPHI|nr:hypothetical protein [Pedobacter insulae]SFH09919.1 hypothetical protein SAMN04489864_10572 [Pedobacter insulae]
MKSKYLFPAWCSLFGYLLTIPGFVLGYLNVMKNFEISGFGFKMREKDGFFQKGFENFTNELCVFLVVIGLILIAFSKSKNEDELNAKLRLNALYWAIMIYYGFYFIWVFLTVIIGEIPFFSGHMGELNLFTPLLIFIFRFYYLKHIKNESYLISEPKFLPHQPFKRIGIIMSLTCLIGLIVGLAIDLQSDVKDSALAIIYAGLIIGLLLWAFSKNKIEDEMVMQHRLESLQMAVYLNYGLILIGTLLLYSLSYLYFLLYAEFSLLLYFVLRMEYVNYKNVRLLNRIEGGISYEE